jgi:hypothetical protein
VSPLDLEAIERDYAESERWTSGPPLRKALAHIPAMLARLRGAALPSGVTLEALEERHAELVAKVDGSHPQHTYEAAKTSLALMAHDHLPALVAALRRQEQIAAAERALRKAEQAALCHNCDVDERAATERFRAQVALRALGVEP